MLAPINIFDDPENLASTIDMLNEKHVDLIVFYCGLCLLPKEVGLLSF